MRRPLAWAVLSAGLVATACGGDAGADDELAIRDAWARPTPAVVSIGAIYLRVTSPVDDELVGASIDPSVAESVQVHRTELDDAGTATMTEQTALPVPADGGLVLAPLGNHLMLVGLVDPLTSGDRFDVTLRFASAGDVRAEVEVRDTEP